MALAVAAVLGAVHVFGNRAHGLHRIPRSWLLSAGSGISVAYVFLHLLPEVAALEDRLGHETSGWWIALAGLAAVYGLELLARRSAQPGPATGGTDVGGLVNLASYAVYNGIVGYLLAERAQASATELLLFAVAMGLHFLVNDHGLREHHAGLYRRIGRWVVAAGVVAGAVLGTLVEPPPVVLEGVIAFLAGGVTMNVLKEELPEDRTSRWTPFVVAAAAYGLLLLAV